MAKNDSKVSKAEQYRKERKQRIAKSAKKSSKKSSSGNNDKLVSRIITIVFCAAVVVGVAYLLMNNFGVFERLTPVAKVGSTSISEAELSFQIRSSYNSLVQNVQQYQQYGYDMGYDTSLAPDAQKYTADDEAEDASEKNKYDTWMDYLTGSSLDAIKERKALCAEAKAAGIKLDNDDNAEIKANIDALEESVLDSAKESGNTTTLAGYLKNAYGKGMTVSLFKKIQEETQLASKYEEAKKDEYAKKYKADDIKKEYQKDTTAYDAVDMRVYTINFADKASTAEDGTKTIAKSEAKSRATKMVTTVKDEATFNKLANEFATKDGDKETYKDKDATLSKNMTASTMDQTDSKGNLKKWAYAKNTKAGDIKMFELDSSYYVAYMVKTAHSTYTYDSRHILFQIEDTENAKESDWNAAKKKAEATLKEWQKGDKSEESFAALAREKSDDTGSAVKGGLCADIAPGSFVSEYESWCLDAKRKKGDVEIVKTQYGYHIIYFIGVSEQPNWDKAIRENKANDEYTKYHEKLVEKAAYKVTKNNRNLTKCEADAVSFIRAIIEQNKNSQQSVSMQ